jgi:hypothetical protein
VDAAAGTEGPHSKAEVLMADATTQIPSWFKWTVGLVATAAVVAGGVTVAREMRTPLPWKTPGPLPKRRTDFQGLELYVLQGDEEEDTWDVLVTDYLTVEGKDMFTGSLREVLSYESKRDAVAAARELGKKARASKKYKLVRVVATPADHRAAEARRRRLEEREA